MVSAQGTAVASMGEAQSYFATLVGDLAGRISTQPIGTLAPTPHITPGPDTHPSEEEVFYAGYSPLRVVLVDSHRLLLEGREGEGEIYRAEEIRGVSWFPDKRHIVFGELTDVDAGRHVEANLRVLDVLSGETHALRPGFDPVVSQAGDQISFKAGTPFSQVCSVEYSLGIIKLDDDFNELQFLSQRDFAGLPLAEMDNSFAPSPAFGIPASGYWLSSTELLVPFRRLCLGEKDEDGIYHLDLETMQTTRILDLPGQYREIARFVPGAPAPLHSIDMLDAQVGWGMGGLPEDPNHIFRTEDGGAHWRDVTPPEPSLVGKPILRSTLAEYLDAQHAWVLSYRYSIVSLEPYRLWRTSDGGRTWNTTDPNNQIDEFSQGNALGLDFVNPNVGWLLLVGDYGMGHEYSGLQKSSDGGMTWRDLVDIHDTEHESGYLNICCKSDMAFVNSDVGVVTYQAAVIPVVAVDLTIDGGLNWSTLELPRPDPSWIGDTWSGIGCTTYDPQLISSTHFKVAVECIIGDDLETTHFLYTTLDQGETWQHVPFPGGEMFFLDEDVGWALGQEIFRTLDGGDNWEKMAGVGWEGEYDFVSSELGWGVINVAGERRLNTTADGGKTWTELDPVIVP